MLALLGLRAAPAAAASPLPSSEVEDAREGTSDLSLLRQLARADGGLADTVSRPRDAVAALAVIVRMILGSRMKNIRVYAAEAEAGGAPVADAAAREAKFVLVPSEDGEAEAVGEPAIVGTRLAVYDFDRTRKVAIVAVDGRRDGRAWTARDEVLLEAATWTIERGVERTRAGAKLVRSRAAFDVAQTTVMFHAVPTLSESDVVNMDKQLRPVDGLTTFDFALPADMTGGSAVLATAVGLFDELDLLTRFSIPRTKLIRLLATVRRNYRPIAYHNWRHGVSVAHGVMLMGLHAKRADYCTDAELLGMLVGAICHDIDHRGQTNSYQVAFDTPLRRLYGDKSVMERHHVAHTLALLRCADIDIFADLGADDGRTAIHQLQRSILATDVATMFGRLAQVGPVLKAGGKLNPASVAGDRDIIKAFVMNASDLADVTKPWDISRPVASNIYEEFFVQGDLEKAAGRKPLPMMDRDAAVNGIAPLQLDFIHNVAMPCFTTTVKLVPELQPHLDGLVNNTIRWEAIKAGKAEDTMPAPSPSKKHAQGRKAKKASPRKPSRPLASSNSEPGPATPTKGGKGKTNKDGDDAAAAATPSPSRSRPRRQRAKGKGKQSPAAKDAAPAGSDAAPAASDAAPAADGTPKRKKRQQHRRRQRAQSDK